MNMSRKPQETPERKAEKMLSSYDIDQIFPRKGGWNKEKKEDLDSLQDKMDADLVRDYKALRAKKIMSQMKDDVDGPPPQEQASWENNPAIVDTLAKLDSETRQQMVTQMMMMRASGGTGGQNANSQLAMIAPYLMMGFQKSNPTAPPMDAAKYAEGVTNQIRLGMDLARQGQPAMQPGGIKEVAEVLRVFSDLVKEGVQDPITRLIERVQPKQSLSLEELIFDPAKANAFKGFFGGGGGVRDSDVEIRLAGITRDTELMKLKNLAEERRWLAEFDATQAGEDKKYALIQNLVQGPIGSFIQRLGGQAASKVNARFGGGGDAQPLSIICLNPQCGRQFFGTQGAKSATCPWCGAVITETGGDANAQEIPQQRRQETRQRQIDPEETPTRQDQAPRSPREEERVRLPPTEESRPERQTTVRVRQAPPTAANKPRYRDETTESEADGVQQ